MTNIDADAPVRWIRCVGCGGLVYERRFTRNLRVCPECGRPARLGARDRLASLLDPGFTELDLVPAPGPGGTVDPLEFVDTVDYPSRQESARAATGLAEAALCARGTVNGAPSIVVAMDFGFLGGSLGWAVGETIARAAGLARAERVPLVVVTASGGARMQEGVVALSQMARTSQAMSELDVAGILTVTVVSDPTYGGVAASFATLADVILVEEGARMGFAGPRVIEDTVRETLPDGFQGSGFLLDNGLVDAVVPRGRLRATLGRLLDVARTDHVPEPPVGPDPVVREPGPLPDLPAWDVVGLARRPGRPTTADYLLQMVEGFVELRGDRVSGDCPALTTGLGVLAGRPVAMIGHQKGHDTRELAAHNFGMARPAGYRKAARVMRLAAKLGLPVVTLIDTPGAYPGPDAEAGGQACAIARSMRLLTSLPVPVVSLVIGEGGSGGALALAIADELLMLSGATYSVISPEGCASILWRSATEAPRAAEALRLGARELLDLRLVDGVVPEPEGGAHTDPAATARLVTDALVGELDRLADLPTDVLLERRRGRLRSAGDHAVLRRGA